MKDFYIQQITELLQQCGDLDLLDLIYSLLAQEASQ